MADDADRSYEELQREEPRDLQVAAFWAAALTREQIRSRVKLPVLLHGETVYVDDEGIWYARTRAQAERLFRLMEPRKDALRAYRLLPLLSAEVYAREAIRLLGAGRVLFKPQYSADDTATPPGSTAA